MGREVCLTMLLIVNGNQTHVLDVSPDADVAQLRVQLSMLEGIDCEQLNLFCSGSPLEDDVNLAVLENQTIDLTIPLKGGKVHGSLARAGKVRGQTPKVEAGEKKKKKTGVLRGGFSTTGALSTWSKPSVARRDPTPTPKCENVIRAEPFKNIGTENYEFHISD